MTNTARPLINIEPTPPTKGAVMNTDEQDIAALIELLNKQPSDGRVLRLTKFARANYSAKTTPCLRCGRKPADAPESESVNFRRE
jgi:hypothetical protein